ncbi:MAG: hypothetical protein RIS90_1377 [Pseudomonadota bacterium]
MHHAPAVSFTVTRSAVHGRWLAATLALGLLVGALWWQHSAEPGWRQGLFLLLYLATAGLALRQWYRTPRGRLQWDGEAWHWSAWPAAGGPLQVRLDGQSWLLVRLRGDAGRTLWLWLERRTEAAAWPALRRAVFAPAPSLTGVGPLAGGPVSAP